MRLGRISCKTSLNPFISRIHFQSQWFVDFSIQAVWFVDWFFPLIFLSFTNKQNDEDVKIVVGDNFDDIVLDESKDVLLEVLFNHCEMLMHNLLSSILLYAAYSNILMQNFWSRSMHHGVGIAKLWSQPTRSLPNIYVPLNLLSSPKWMVPQMNTPRQR